MPGWCFPEPGPGTAVEEALRHVESRSFTVRPSQARARRAASRGPIPGRLVSSARIACGGVRVLTG